MIDLTYLVSGVETGSVPHRYGRKIAKEADARPHAVADDAAARRPVVVWNVTRTCNLRCQHCYSDSDRQAYAGELSTAEATALLEDLAAFRVPAVLFSGGEPLVRPDILKLASWCSQLGLRAVLSTNGTLIDADMARRLKDAGLVYVGVSIDGKEETHDRFRASKGAFRRAVEGIRRLKEVGQKVGLRMTLTAWNADDVGDVFALADAEGIDRLCFYHLVPSGRGASAASMEPAKVRAVVDRIVAFTRERTAAGRKIEVLTVDNPCDGPYLVMSLAREGRAAEAGRAADLLKWNGGAAHGSGTGLACIDNRGDVHPDQFWTAVTLGNVRQRRFSDLWFSGNGLLAQLRDRRKWIQGRCASCRWFDLCGGGFRARAAIGAGDPWAPDPGCYLTNDEVFSQEEIPCSRSPSQSG